jgi:hypothetical protein
VNWLRTRRGVRRATTNTLSAFGVIALALQSYQAVWDRPVLSGHGTVVAVVTGLAAVAYGLLHARPGRVVRRDMRHPDSRVEIVPGDLFDQDDAHLVVGFTDVFDTDVTDGRVIHEGSVQAQFLRRVYGDDAARLDAELTGSLAHLPSVVSPRSLKPYGKLRRYPMGTVAVLGVPRRLFFCLAYSTMTADLLAQSSTDDLWNSLSRLWEEVHRRGQHGTLAMPIVGAGLARIDSLDRDELLRLILLSFVAASRQRVITTRLRIVVPPEQFDRLDRLELQAFLNTL